MKKLQITSNEVHFEAQPSEMWILNHPPWWQRTAALLLLWRVMQLSTPPLPPTSVPPVQSTVFRGVQQLGRGCPRRRGNLPSCEVPASELRAREGPACWACICERYCSVPALFRSCPSMSYILRQGLSDWSYQVLILRGVSILCFPLTVAHLFFLSPFYFLTDQLSSPDWTLDSVYPILDLLSYIRTDRLILPKCSE